MKPIYFITKRRPVSYNKKEQMQKYKREIKSEFDVKYAQLYDNLPLASNSLKTRIVYIHRIKHINQIPDIDNLSKPIIDAFSGTIYIDDSQVVDRNATILRFNDFDFATVDATNMPFEIYQAFEKYFNEKSENIVLFGVVTIDINLIKVGEI